MESKYPAPPKIFRLITGQRITELLLPYGIKLRVPSDSEYGLPSKTDWLRFLVWYKKHAPVKPGDYTKDDYDCDDFAWVQRAYALLWMKGVCPFGYVEAQSIDPKYPYQMHAFCFFIDWRENVYFTDPLELAASMDGLDPAYEVYGQDAKV